MIKRISSIILALLFVAPAFAKDGKWDPRTPLKYPSSLHSMVMHNSSNVSSVLGLSCMEAVRKHLEKGGNFATKFVVENSLPFEQFPRQDVTDNRFFHWTESPGPLGQIAHKRTFGDLLVYARENVSNPDRWAFYVAADPDSSRVFGTISYKLTLQKGTKVFFSQGDKPGASTNTVVDSDLSTARELFSRNRYLVSCRSVILRLLSLEASNVSLVAYFGVDNHVSYGVGRGYQWFEVINAWAIKSMELVK